MTKRRLAFVLFWGPYCSSVTFLQVERLILWWFWVTSGPRLCHSVNFFKGIMTHRSAQSKGSYHPPLAIANRQKKTEGERPKSKRLSKNAYSLFRYRLS